MSAASQKRIMPRIPWKGVVIISVGLLTLTWLVFTPAGVLGKADAIGYSLCHRIDARSFHIGIRQFPLCARCTGQFLGALLALAFQALTGRRGMGKPGRGVMAVLVILFLAYAVDGLNSYLHLAPLMQSLPDLPRLYEPNNTLRLLTGTGIGLVLGAGVYPAFNSSVWRTPDPRPALRGLGWLGLLILLALGLDGLVLLEIPWLMALLAILSTLAALTLLGMVYTIVILMLARQENRFERSAQLILPMIGGLGIALLQVAVVDLLRYLLTGTWDGFYLG